MKNFDLECPECGDVERSSDWKMCKGVRGKRHGPVAMYRVMDWGKYGRPQELAKEDFVENKGKTKRDKVKDNKSDESQEVLATTLR